MTVGRLHRRRLHRGTRQPVRCGHSPAVLSLHV